MKAYTKNAIFAQYAIQSIVDDNLFNDDQLEYGDLQSLADEYSCVGDDKEQFDYCRDEWRLFPAKVRKEITTRLNKMANSDEARACKTPNELVTYCASLSKGLSRADAVTEIKTQALGDLLAKNNYALYSSEVGRVYSIETIKGQTMLKIHSGFVPFTESMTFNNGHGRAVSL